MGGGDIPLYNIKCQVCGRIEPLEGARAEDAIRASGWQGGLCPACQMRQQRIVEAAAEDR